MGVKHTGFTDIGMSAHPNYRLRASIRNRLSRYRGRQFELFILRKLRAAGFTANRVDESSGYTHGVDILVRLDFRLVPIQVKRTAEWKDLFVALYECRQNCPKDPLVVAVHGWAPAGSKKPRITIAISEQPDKPFTMQIITLQELIGKLKSLPPLDIAPPPSTSVSTPTSDPKRS